MNTEVYDSETSDVLARWWWPGQWLRIVWSVWVDQKWYWEHVYPRLENRRRGWGIFVQAWLGAMLIALCLLLIGSLVSGSLGMDAVQDQFALAGLLSLAGILALLCFGVKLLFGPVVGVPFTAVCIPTIAVYTFRYVWSMDTQGSWLVYCTLCLVWGLAYGVLRGVSEGGAERNDIVIQSFVVFMLLSTIPVPGIPNRFLLLLGRAAVTFILSGAAICGGARWSTRDLPEEIAERLKKRGKADA